MTPFVPLLLTSSSLPDPVWPVIVLAFIQIADGVMSVKPVGFIAQCLENVHFPKRFWWVLSPLKFAAALGLLAGIVIPFVGVITSVALVAYFVVAVVSHLVARDIGRDLFLNTFGMLTICIATLTYSFLL